MEAENGPNFALKPLRSAADYETARRIASDYFNNEPEPGSREGDHFEMLIMLIAAYEEKNLPIVPPDPVDAIRFRMEQTGLTPKDLEPMIGRMNRVYEVLARKRPLTLPMIRRLHAGLGIPAESLIAEPMH
jgi:HTH-type transcriptional regulator/antitoxin HigA